MEICDFNLSFTISFHFSSQIKDQTQLHRSIENQHLSYPNSLMKVLNKILLFLLLFLVFYDRPFQLWSFKVTCQAVLYLVDHVTSLILDLFLDPSEKQRLF